MGFINDEREYTERLRRGEPVHAPRTAGERSADRSEFIGRSLEGKTWTRLDTSLVKFGLLIVMLPLTIASVATALLAALPILVLARSTGDRAATYWRVFLTCALATLVLLCLFVAVTAGAYEISNEYREPFVRQVLGAMWRLPELVASLAMPSLSPAPDTFFERTLLPGVIPTAIALLSAPGLLGAIGVMYFRNVPETNGLAGLLKATMYIVVCVISLALVAWSLFVALEKWLPPLLKQM